MSKVIKGSPFDLAGYTEDTKFRVIKDYETLKVGDIVTLKEDDYSDCPGFCTEDGRYEYMRIPSEDDQELEVYEEPNEDKEALNKLKDEIEAVHKNKKPFVGLCNYPKDPICSTDKQKLSLLARIIVSEDDLFNGHSQVTISSKLTPEDLTELMGEIDRHFERGGIDSYTEARFSADGSGSLYAVGYWDKGEHSLGHTDKLLLSWGAR